MKIGTYSCMCAVIVGLMASGCSPTPPISDTVLEKVVSPSGESIAYVVYRETMLAQSSLLVFAGRRTIDVKKAVPVIALTDGTPPSITFLDNQTLEVRIFGGSKHNQKFEADGINVIYK